MKRQGISIRYKILALMTSIPVITLTIYLALATKIFEDDKVAYVFDSSSGISGTMSAQIKTQFNSVLSKTRPIFQEFLLQGKFSGVSDAIFQNETNFESIVSYNLASDGIYKETAVLEKTEQGAASLISRIGPEFSSYLIEANKSGRLVKVPFKDDQIFIFEKVSDEATRRSTIFLVIVKMTEAAEMFNTMSSQKIFLINQSGQILFGPEGVVGLSIVKEISQSFLKSLQGKIAQGAEGHKSSRGEDLLVSYAKVGFGDLIVVTAVEKKKALGAVKILVRKSLIFFCVLISLTIIISLFASSGLTQALTELFAATRKVAQGEFNIKVRVSSSDEVGALANNFNIMAGEVSRLLDQTAEKARMESELQTAKTVQETLFPETLKKLGSLSIGGYYEPASECGGDWWHYCQVGQKIFLWIGDATGHGAPAALITSAAKSAATIIETMDVSVSGAMGLLNRAIYDVSKGRIMMTFFLATFDITTSEMRYCNASHEVPLLLKKSDKPLKKNDLIPLNDVISPRLGQNRNTVFEEFTLQLDKEDSVFFYTDGVIDIQNPKKQAWGERSFVNGLIEAKVSSSDVETFVKKFSANFSQHRSGAPLVDDVTFFVVKNDQV